MDRTTVDERNRAAPAASSDPRAVKDTHRIALGPTRTSWTWVFLVVGLLLGIALIDFVAQNTRSTEIEFFWASGRVPLAVALLVAALAAAFVVLVVGVLRMFQLRRGLRARSKGTNEAGMEPLDTSERPSAARDPQEPSRGSGRVDPPG